MSPILETPWIVEKARSIGFDRCGVVRAEEFSELAQTSEWLARGYGGEMKYLEDPRRTDLRSALPGIRSVIVCLLNYQTAHPLSTESTPQNDQEEPRGWISRYAWGSDYHEVLRARLDLMMDALRGHFAEPFEARSYVDTGPVQERVPAKHAGLGWLGKNTLLLNETLGSYFFLGVILTTLDLTPSLAEDELPPPDLCGNCRQCLDACPTQAFVEPYVMDARRCISYLTIELRKSIPEELREPMGRHVFGCDICQDVCPWNQRAPITALEEFQPRVFPALNEGRTHISPSAESESLFLPRLEWLASLSEAEFRKVFRDSPIKRTKWRGLVRNACNALGNSDLQRGKRVHSRVIALLEQLASSAEPVVAESAQWVLSRIQ